MGRQNQKKEYKCTTCKDTGKVECGCKDDPWFTETRSTCHECNNGWIDCPDCDGEE